jgi:hypothetical protein
MLIQVSLELEVAIGDDSDEMPAALDDWNSGDSESRHQRDRFA